MNRYRVHIVPRSGRFAPVLTVLVEADSPDEASEAVRARSATMKVIAAEAVGDRTGRGKLRVQDAGPRLRVWSS
jgi:hypothetical protein